MVGSLPDISHYKYYLGHSSIQYTIHCGILKLSIFFYSKYLTVNKKKKFTSKIEILIVLITLQFSY